MIKTFILALAICAAGCEGFKTQLVACGENIKFTRVVPRTISERTDACVTHEVASGNSDFYCKCVIVDVP